MGKKILAVLCLLMSAVSFIYFATLIWLVGFTNTFNYFWVILALFFLGLFFVVAFSKKGLQALPKPLLIFVEAVVFLGCFMFVVVEAFIIKGSVKKPEKEADYIIVLGAQVRGTVPSLILEYRIGKAAEYLKEHPATIAVVSGGKGPDEGISEAEAMKRGLIAKGISNDRIIMEDKSTSTKENLDFSKQYIEEGKHVVIVTTDFHVLRATSIAKRAGYSSVEGLAAKSVWYLIPNNYVREFLAVLKDKLVGNM